MKNRLPVDAHIEIRAGGTCLSLSGNFPFQSADPDPTFRAGYSSPETLAAQRQLAWILDGRYKNIHAIRTGIPRRLSGSGSLSRKPDVLLNRGYSELKFAGDRVNRSDLQMDVWLQHRGLKVRYDIVSHPYTSKVSPLGDLERLKIAAVPYKKWGSEFWSLGKGDGLKVQMSWPPENAPEKRSP